MISALLFSNLRPAARLVSAAAALFFVIAGCAAEGFGQAAEAALDAVEPFESIEREAAGEFVHNFRLTPGRGRAVRLVVEQRGADVMASVFAPGGSKLYFAETPNGAYGPETLFFVAEEEGDYRVEVRSAGSALAGGGYGIRLTSLADATGNDRARMDAQRAFMGAEALREKGDEASLVRAVEGYEAAAALWRGAGAPEGEARALVVAGIVRHQLGRFQESVETLTRARELWRQAGERAWEVETLTNVGALLVARGEREKGLAVYVEALPLWRGLKIVGGEARTLSNMGAVYYFFGDYHKAAELFRQSLPLRQAAGDTAGEASTLTNVGAAYLALGETPGVLEYYERALPLWRKAGDRHGEAQTLNNIAHAHLLTGRSGLALDFYAQGLALRREIGDATGQADTLNNLGALLNTIGDTDGARRRFEEALEISRASNYRPGEATALHGLGDVARAGGDTAAALGLFAQALPLRRELKDRAGEAHTLARLGMTHHLAGDARRSLALFDEALAIWRAAGSPLWQADVLLHQGRAREALGERARALEQYAQALELWRGVRSPHGQASALYAIASALKDEGRFDESLARIEEGLGFVESLRAGIPGADLRASYLASAQRFYELHVELFMLMHAASPRAGHDARALAASERARARGLTELLTEREVDVRRGVEPAVLERERGLRQLLLAKTNLHVRLLGDRKNAARAAEVSKEIVRLSGEYEETRALIRRRSPAYAALTQPVPLSLAEKQRLLDADTVLLEYSLGEKRSHLWAVTHDSLDAYELPPRGEVERAARRFYGLLTAPNAPTPGESDEQRRGRLARAEEELPAAAAELSRVVLGPAAPRLGSKRLLVVADGALHYVPFAALAEPAGAAGPARYEPLGLRHEVVKLPSATTLAVMRRELAGRRPAARQLAVVADPVFSPSDPRVKARRGPDAPQGTPGERAAAGRTRSAEVVARAAGDLGLAGGAQSLTRLPFTRREAEVISSRLGAGEVFKALDFEASHAAVAGGRLSGHRVVHFATHGLLDSRNPELSGLVLSLVDERGQPVEGFMRLADIYNLDLPAELVVLSACQTGLGKEVRGEGLVGLTRGFMYAGAPRVIASLWRVDDAGTSELMKGLYEGMYGRGLRPAAALREAQARMWREPRWRTPYYWAAFELHGEWR